MNTVYIVFALSLIFFMFYFVKNVTTGGTEEYIIGNIITSISLFLSTIVIIARNKKPEVHSYRKGRRVTYRIIP